MAKLVTNPDNGLCVLWNKKTGDRIERASVNAVEILKLDDDWSATDPHSRDLVQDEEEEDEGLPFSGEDLIGFSKSVLYGLCVDYDVPGVNSSSPKQDCVDALMRASEDNAKLAHALTDATIAP